MGLFGPPNVEKLKTTKNVKGLIKALGYQKDRDVRLAAVEALGAIGDPRSVEPLIAALKDEWEWVRQASLEALGKIGLPAVGLLTSALEDGSWLVRSNAAQALGKIGLPALEPLITALKDEKGQVRGAAALALGYIGDARAVELLVAALKDEDSQVRAFAALALDEQCWMPREDATGARYWVAKQEWSRCIPLGAFAVEPLIAELKYGRIPAADALGKIGDVRAVEPLIAALSDENRHVRLATVRALDEIGDVGAAEPLNAMLRDKDADVRWAAAVALAGIGDARAVEPLVAQLNGSLNVRRSCAKALVDLYQSGSLDETHQRAILAERSRIAETHDDHDHTHMDSVSLEQQPNDCAYPVHTDLNERRHTDSGIGVAFPV